VSIVHQTVHDGVGERRLAEPFVPVVDGDLTGDDGGFSAVPVFHDFQEITPLSVERSTFPIVSENAYKYFTPDAARPYTSEKHHCTSELTSVQLVPPSVDAKTPPDVPAITVVRVVSSGLATKEQTRYGVS
jgi:hypothetical protein